MGGPFGAGLELTKNVVLCPTEIACVGPVIETVGCARPTETATEPSPRAPVTSVTIALAVNAPSRVYVCTWIVGDEMAPRLMVGEPSPGSNVTFEIGLPVVVGPGVIVKVVGVPTFGLFGDAVMPTVG